MSVERDQEVDFLVIGGGIAGLRAAIELAPVGRVLLTSKGTSFECRSPHGNTGATMAPLAEDEEVFLRLHDSIRVGDGLCREHAMRVLVEEGPQQIEKLIDWSNHFDRNGSRLAFARKSELSRARVLHAHGDSTTRAIRSLLIAKVKSLGSVQVRGRAPSVDLLVDGDRVCGAIYLDQNTGAFKRVQAGRVLLATGGLGQVYQETTNPPSASGDGVCLALRKGALLGDMEFVQFYPTVLYAKGAPRFVLSEDLRTQGAKLRNIELERFMARYHEAGELAPPDVVSRAIMLEMQRCRSEFVYLDMSRLNAERVKKLFPRIYTACLEHNIDITADLVPVSPAAHYAIGGVATDLHGSTTLKGLYAAGEVATNGLHGANHLASNALLECLVYGARAACAMIKGCSSFEAPTATSRPQAIPADSRHPPRSTAAVDTPTLASKARRIMWEHVGTIRRGRELGEAVRRLDNLAQAAKACACTAHLEAQNLLELAPLIARSAAAREESRGVHYRVDFPLRQESVPSLHSYVSANSSVYFAP
jgi:L-aspartate oxidase